MMMTSRSHVQRKEKKGKRKNEWRDRYRKERELIVQLVQETTRPGSGDVKALEAAPNDQCDGKGESESKQIEI